VHLLDGSLRLLVNIGITRNPDVIKSRKLKSYRVASERSRSVGWVERDTFLLTTWRFEFALRCKSAARSYSAACEIDDRDTMLHFPNIEF
jgi:hypothetical protein